MIIKTLWEGQKIHVLNEKKKKSSDKTTLLLFTSRHFIYTFIQVIESIDTELWRVFH